MIHAIDRILMLPLLMLDCLGSVLLGENFSTTLSAKAHEARAKHHPWWSWTAGFIDALFFFQPDHCEKQWLREQQYGGVWKAWFADFKGTL